MAISKIIYKANAQDTGTIWMDATPATAAAADITAPKTAMLADGVLTTGTGSGGGSSYKLIGSNDFTVNTSSTSETSVGTIVCTNANLFALEKIIYVKVRDKAGARTNHFYGSDQWYGIRPGQSSTSMYVQIRYIYSAFMDVVYGTSGYGVYSKKLSSTNNVEIMARYNSSNSLTIDGTYSVEVYELDWPNDVSPFD